MPVNDSGNKSSEILREMFYFPSMNIPSYNAVNMTKNRYQGLTNHKQGWDISRV